MDYVREAQLQLALEALGGRRTCLREAEHQHDTTSGLAGIYGTVHGGGRKGGLHGNPSLGFLRRKGGFRGVDCSLGRAWGAATDEGMGEGWDDGKARSPARSI